MPLLTYIKGPAFRTRDSKGPIFVDPRSKKEAAIRPSRTPIEISEQTLERLLANDEFNWWFIRGHFLVDGKHHPKAHKRHQVPVIEKPRRAYVEGKPTPVQGQDSAAIAKVPTREQVLAAGYSEQAATGIIAGQQALANGATPEEAEQAAELAIINETTVLDTTIDHGNPDGSGESPITAELADAGSFKDIHHTRAVNLIPLESNKELLERWFVSEERSSVSTALEKRLSEL